MNILHNKALELQSTTMSNNITESILAEVLVLRNEMKEVKDQLAFLVKTLKGEETKETKEAKDESPKQKAPRQQAINLSFKDLYVNNKEKAIEVFGLKRTWINTIEKNDIAKEMKDDKKKESYVAKTLWETHFADDDAKKKAKEAYHKYTESLTVKA
jgi:uncharacterized protein (DUF305 family)